MIVRLEYPIPFELASGCYRKIDEERTAFNCIDVSILNLDTVQPCNDDITVRKFNEVMRYPRHCHRIRVDGAEAIADNDKRRTLGLATYKVWILPVHHEKSVRGRVVCQALHLKSTRQARQPLRCSFRLQNECLKDTFHLNP